MVHKQDVTPVMRAVQKAGVVEFAEIDASPLLHYKEKSEFEFDYVSNRLDFAVEFLSRYAPARGKLRSMLEEDRVVATEEDLAETANKFYFNDTIDSLQNLEEALNDTDSKLKTLEEESALLSAWQDIDAPLGGGLETKHTLTLLFEGEEAERDMLADELTKQGILFDVPIKHSLGMAIVVFKEDKEAVLQAARLSKVELTTLPRRRGTPAEELERIVRAKKKVAGKKIELENEVRKHLIHLPELKKVGDYMFWKKEKHDAISRGARTDGVIVFEGWCPKDEIKDLENEISKAAKTFAIEQIEPKEGEVPPVEIKNNRLIRPFETITRLYGLPGNKDLDPTLFLAGFFFVFFGLCLTDVGYGAVLMLASGLMLYFYRVAKGLKMLLSLLMFGGFASILAGLLFGGYLGIDPSLLPSWAIAIQHFDPIKNPLPIFYMALGLGVVQIMFGLVLGIIRAAKEDSLSDGLLDHGPWLFVFVSLILFGVHTLGYLGGDAKWFTWIIYASIVFLFVAQGRKEPTLAKKITKGLVSLYDSIGYFSDVLSYSRLLALGLATSALAFAVNLIAQIIGDMVPYVGPVLMVAILIVGHIFTLAVNALGAFIHSARLQFVEFFGKFITGNGRGFTPFKREERYVTLK